MGAALGSESFRRTQKANASTTWTWSGWVNIAGTRQVDEASDYLFSWRDTDDNTRGFAISRASDKALYLWNGTANVAKANRDGGGFYHVVVSVNNGTATAYINGVQYITGVSYAPPKGGAEVVVGDWILGNNKVNGSMFDVYFVDGQALSPSVFAETSADKNNHWHPKFPSIVSAAIGSYGTTGFYLPMQRDTSNIGTLADDNSKTWTVGGNPRYVKAKSLTGVTPPGDTAIHLDSTKTTDYIRLVDNDLDLNSKAWTAEFFVSRGETWNVSKGVISLDTTSNSSYESFLFYTTSTGIVLYMSSTGNTWDIFSAAGVITTMDKYRNYHIALTRQTDGTIRLYVNGTYVQGSNGNVVSGRTQLTLGSRASISGIGDLTISGWRIIKDTALYTGTGSFTPPTSLDNSVNGTVTHYSGTNAIDSLGQDESGNENHFITDNFEHNHLTQHSIRNKFCTWMDESGFDGTVGDGGTMTTTNDILGSIGVHSGKWYWEFTAADMFTGAGGGGNIHHFGVVAGNSNEEVNSGVFGRAKVGRRADTQVMQTAGYGISSISGTGTLANFGDNSIIGFALDLDSSPRTLKYYENGTLQYTQSFDYTYYGYNDLIPFARSNGLEGYYNFGQGTWVTSNSKNGYSDANSYGRFQYAPPSGYLAICTANVPLPSGAKNVDQHYKQVSYTGTGSTQAITGVGFKPCFAWVKVMNTSYSGGWFDRIRGADNMLWPDSTTRNYGAYTNELISFDSDGFTTGGNLHTGTSGRPYTALLFKGPETPSTNNVGTVTSTVYANDEGGFSLVGWTGNGGAEESVGTGLTGKSCFTIVGREDSGIADWWTYHGEDNYARARMNLPDAGFIGTTNGVLHEDGKLYFNAPDFNENGGSYFAYTWKTVPGFIKEGRYISTTNSNGPFVYTGFRPTMVLTKRLDSNGSWQMVLANNNQSNPSTTNYTVDTGVVQTFDGIDFLSNGFKVRQNGGAFNGYDNNTYLYFAIGTPFADSASVV
jgi:hypothetical protein